ncbi:MAG: sigma-70 family RNA polymerase sigma factor [Gammaproteobacteria bacterium]|nr:sigma-70 family RNA polymerase sigma factor [Gammaproteobacteria bacterium]
MRGKRSRAEFERLMLPHLPAAYALACWLTRHPQDAEDRVQDAYLKAYEGFRGYAGGDSAAWLLAIVRNTCLTWLKRHASKGKVVRFDEAMTALEVRTPQSESNLSPDGAILSIEVRDRVRAALFKLPFNFREVIVLREFAELSYAQIAHVVGVPIGTVMSRISRGRGMLRELLNEEDDCGQRPGM